MYVAEKYFANDSSELVLKGDGTSKGVLFIIKEFSGTNAYINTPQNRIQNLQRLC
jgi:hypothetical protein